MTYEEIQNHIKSIRNIGHRHEEIQEWFDCKPCVEANTKAIAQENIYKASYPKLFEMHRIKMKAPRKGKYVHKL